MTTADRKHHYGKEFTCHRCRSRVDGIHNEDHEAVLEVLGWHVVDKNAAEPVRFCSKGCLEWHRALAGRGEPIKIVEQLADRAYQQRRAALNVPSSSPPVAKR